MKKLILAATAFLLVMTGALAQNSLKQVVKGVVIDADSKNPLTGATISIGTSSVLTDSLGQFQLNDIAIGRRMVTITNIGFDTRTVEAIVTSGKEVFLTISLVENIRQLEEIKVVGRRNRSKALNEFASASARSFSVEETKRYPAAAYDPARMATNFAGVSSNGDFNNEIVVRGNSPKGVLWRMEGIEIPNPNHFGTLGNSGGAISMLSSSTLGSSDFYTGAFPAEFGSALSGVFDLNLRTGNRDKREYAFMLGGLGIEAAAEGPFKKGGNASYLVNYRYSTLSLLKGFLDIGGVLPEYQDLSFKLNFPTKKAGTFNFFGLGGSNTANKKPVNDSTKWTDDDPNFVLAAKGKTGVAGISHQYFLNEKSFIKTILSASGNTYREVVDSLNPSSHYSLVNVVRTKTSDVIYRASLMYNNKISANHTVRAGLTANHQKYDYSSNVYDEVDATWYELLGGKGRANYFQGYVQWKYRLSQEWTLNTGLHSSYFDLNSTYTVEPRVALSLQPGNNQTFTLAAGLHAKPEHLSTYQYQPHNSPAGEFPNAGLEIPKAAHLVLGYERGFQKGFRLKAEAYYQRLYDIPVEGKENSHFSILNTSGIYELYDIGALVSKGKGRNYGLDLTVEKPFSRNYYLLFTGSIYQSKYTNFEGKEFNSRFNRQWQMNIVSGKEWGTGKGRKNVIGLNGKFLSSGGLKESVIDLEASKATGKVQYVKDQYYTITGDVYFRFDIGFSYKINKRSSTHTISLDVQNVTNQQNLFHQWYDNDKQKLKKMYQMGFFPIFNYRIEF